MSDTSNISTKEVRSFFKKISWKKILTFLFFVLLASIFWLMIVWRQKFEATLAIPIKYENVPDSIVFENDLPTDIYIHLRDDGAAIFRYYLTRKRDSLTIDVRDIIKSSQEKVIQGRNLEQLVRGKLLISSELISYSPMRISYVHAILHQKKLPVIYDGNVNLASGYLIDGELTISPDSVLAYGSKAALDTVLYAYTVNDTLNNVISNTKIQVAMRSYKGIKYIPNSVELSIPVDKFNSKEVEVPVTCVNLPDNVNIRIFPSSVKIPFNVGLKRYDNITSSDFQVTIDYNSIKEQQETTKETSITVRITKSPDYIQTKIPIPSEIEFVLEQK